MKDLEITNKTWTEESFFEALTTNCGEAEANVAKRILIAINSKIKEFWFGEGKRGSIVPVFKHGGKEYYPFSLIEDGKIEIYFQWHSKKAPFDKEKKRLELLGMLNKIEGVDIAKDKINARPTIELKLLLNKTEFNKFIDAIKFFFEEIEKI